MQFVRNSVFILGLSLASASLVGCGRESSVPTSAGSTTDPTQQGTLSRVGDVSIRANVTPTAMIGEAVAAQYGIERDEHSMLLLVSVSQGPEAQETALPAQVTATVTDLRGVSQTIEMREVRSGSLIDYLGTVRVTPPDTLRFDLVIVREGGARSTMQFSRDVFPR